MPEAEHNPREQLGKETMIGLARQSVIQANEQNSNALGLVIHGSRANEGLENEKQPRINSDLDVITIRKRGDREASEVLANALWTNVGPRYAIVVDTGPWGSLEWEEVTRAIESEANREKLREKWKHLGNTSIIVSANPEIELVVKKALFE